VTIHVRPLQLPAESSLIFDLPRRLHRADPQWVAPLELYERHRLKPSNPLFETAEIVVFGAFRGSELVGTASALKDRNFDRDEGIVWFGFFETEPDSDIAEALFERVIEQAQRWGAVALRGPRNLTRWEYVGLTVEGFDTLPPMLQGHHPPYYATLLESLGMDKHHDTLAYEVSLYETDGSEKQIPATLLDKANGCDIPGLEVRRARWRSMNRDLVRAHEVLNEAYRTVPDVSPMPRATFLALGRAYLVFANTELMQLGLVDGAPAAFSVCLPEINEALVHARGKLLPTGLFRFVNGLRGVRTAAFKLIGVKPEYRGTGLHAKMIVNVIHSARRAGYSRIDGSVIDERNKPMRGVVEGAGMQVYRRYRHYELKL